LGVKLVSEPICCIFRVVAALANIIIVGAATSVTTEAGKWVGCHHGGKDY
jgi:hypothetical protein